MFKHTEHTKKYFSKCLDLSKKLVEFDWENVKTFGIDMNSGDGGIGYQFLKFSSKLFVKIQETNNLDIDELLKDDNILSMGLIKINSGSSIPIHKDHDYWSSQFHRIHIPLKNSGAYFIYDEEKIIWKPGEVYIFNVMGIPHGAVNDTDDDFEMVYVDISKEPIENTNKKQPNALAQEYQKKFLETVPDDLIFTEYKKQCTEEELKAQEEYLDQYKHNLKMR